MKIFENPSRFQFKLIGDTHKFARKRKVKLEKIEPIN